MPRSRSGDVPLKVQGTTNQGPQAFYAVSCAAASAAVASLGPVLHHPDCWPWGRARSGTLDAVGWSVANARRLQADFDPGELAQEVFNRAMLSLLRSDTRTYVFDHLG
jgi:hypothetical protein